MHYFMSKHNMQRQFLLFSFSFFIHGLASSQDTVRFSIENDYGLPNYSKTFITSPTGLHPFFERLYQLKKDKKGNVNILHIGDSHIQADYITHQLRQNFQREFGNAGRGFIAPFKVAQTNEPANYTSQSESKWESKRVVFPDQPLPMGIGGVTIRSETENASIKITLKNFPELDYSFNKATAYFLKENRSYHIALTDSLMRDIAFMGNFSLSNTINAASVGLPYFTNSISIKSIKSLPGQNRVTYFGFNFENGRPGILYHSIGANGAKYKHYLSAEYFAEQSKSLNSDLIVLALGTNEALDHPYADPKFLEYVDALIQKIKSQNPNAVFLISIPPDSFKKKNKKNPSVLEIRKKLIEYAEEKHLAYFDLFEAGGGAHSAPQWRKAELLRDDGVHFTRAAYELQGNMFYLALMKAYNQYVSDGHR